MTKVALSLKLEPLLIEREFDPEQYFVDKELHVYQNNILRRWIVWITSFFSDRYDELKVAESVTTFFAQHPPSSINLYLKENLKKLEGRLAHSKNPGVKQKITTLFVRLEIFDKPIPGVFVERHGWKYQLMRQTAEKVVFSAAYSGLALGSVYSLFFAKEKLGGFASFGILFAPQLFAHVMLPFIKEKLEAHPSAITRSFTKFLDNTLTLNISQTRIFIPFVPSEFVQTLYSLAGSSSVLMALAKGMGGTPQLQVKLGSLIEIVGLGILLSQQPELIQKGWAFLLDQELSGGGILKFFKTVGATVAIGGYVFRSLRNLVTPHSLKQRAIPFKPFYVSTPPPVFDPSLIT